MDDGKGLWVRGSWSVEKARYSPSECDWAPVGDHSLIPPFNMGINVDLDPIFCDDYFMNVLRGLGLKDAWYTEKEDILPVNVIGPQWWITHSSPPPPLISFSELLFTLSPWSFLKSNILVTICLRYEYISICLHAQPSIDAALIFSLVLFVYLFFFWNVII